ncbi:DUF6083 domain-containing protein [Streptomyces longisporoflavus]|uniref:DUF6083 domain-containing protein n=1 Tax=Streptomyces longisporoflavus TaxID=28044 RepID=A0ABW7QJ60_9ACTN
MKNAELGDLAQCDVCRMGVRQHYDTEGSLVELDLREAPVGLVPEGLRWCVAGDGTAINLGHAGPETVRVGRHDACHSLRPDLTNLRTLFALAPVAVVGPLPRGVNTEAEIYKELRRTPTREQVRSIICPYCDADPGLPCVEPARRASDGEPRSAHHKERTTAYRRARWQTWRPGTPVPSRDHVRTVACPACTAPPHQPCRQRSGCSRLENHRERAQAFLNPEQGGAGPAGFDAAGAACAPGTAPAREVDERPRSHCGECGAVIFLIGRALEDGLCKLCREEAAELAAEART